MDTVMERQKDLNPAKLEQRQKAAPSVREATFTSDELAEILKQANSRDTTVSTIDEAIETARELGIPEQHVLDAAKTLQEKKIRRDVLRRRSRAALQKLVRYLGTMAFVVILVGFVSGVGVAKLVAFGMGIAAFVMTAQWIKALFNERFPPEK